MQNLNINQEKSQKNDFGSFSQINDKKAKFGGLLKEMKKNDFWLIFEDLLKNAKFKSSISKNLKISILAHFRRLMLQKLNLAACSGK